MTVPYQESAETGRICYEAFAGALGWRWKGEPLKPWADLELFEKDAFRAGAHDVIQKGWVTHKAPAGRHTRLNDS